MDRFGLNAEEYLITELLFEAVESNSTAGLMEYYKLPCVHTGLFELITSLQNKGVILKSCKFVKGQALDPEVIQFNDTFLRNYRKTSGALGVELLQAYPNEAIINGQAVPLKNYSKKYNSTEEFYFYYGKAIGWNLQKHQHVLELIEWSKSNDNFGLNMNIGDFVGSRMWESIETHKDGGGSIIIDTLTAI